MQSILPVRDIYKKIGSHNNKHKNIKKLNTTLKQHTTTNHYAYIDLYTSFCNENGMLIKEFSNDGLHLKEEGYLLWKHFVYLYIYNLELKPSLSPKTQLPKWNMFFFAIIFGYYNSY
ncbi:SGNH/GDSL hydrolase family protein [Flavobacterium sp. MAHUQ-51]|uniref:hypothetical protein n=1 Tax=Flavobacterium sp. GCM10022190 TaxID=3252639 RepID=UPI0036081581